MRTTSAATALAVLAIGLTPLAACSGDDAGHAPTDTRTVTVTMTDNAYLPTRVSAEPGEQVTFRFVNDGRMTHEAYLGSQQEQERHAAEMSGSGGHHSMGMGDDGIVTVEPGREATLTEVFDRAGTVVIGCHQPGHWESGMRATVDVG
ncbi:MAG TPA: cupredoxin domain-containing protein [Microthrixaceae bacterium]|nr:cupredoxin domain-containing protein [Microthrixaceae bacterium]